ncbi:hypothetical protein BDY19DRAFT_883196 [Irpex rosettiformis]|uniref:Uncharacterized protein n=1 Tax=Irpex rosettiformis TaxID=378272 RepID=A0ACB8UGX0_9APHY|nr:hypothetical protein BDY19DRAFT_883196 [Irpex rosettiformis]
MTIGSLKYKLIGIIYYGSMHFTSRIIDSSGSIWYHDGIETASTCIYEGNIVNMNPKDLTSTKHAHQYSTIIYALQT